MSKIFTKPVCLNCGSNNLEFNLYAYWNMIKRTYDISEVSRVYCCDCESEDHYEYIHYSSLEHIKLL